MSIKLIGLINELGFQYGSPCDQPKPHCRHLEPSFAGRRPLVSSPRRSTTASGRHCKFFSPIRSFP